MNECATTFRKGLRIFWVQECKPILRNVTLMTWLLLTVIWLVAPMGKNPFWLNFMGGISVAVIVILVAVYFIRHVLRLDKGEKIKGF
jgi:hypothetical protein